MDRRVESDLVSAPPVFFLHDEVPEDVTHVDICLTAEKLVGFGAIVGAQRLGGLWRLYPTNPESRAKLLTAKLLIGGRSVPMRAQNPFAMRGKDGNEIPSTRLTIDGLPVSVSTSDLEGYLRKAGVAFRSAILWEKARDREGKLTRWVIGRRFVWIDLPATPLPHQLQIGAFVARLYYREQPRPTITCFSCGKEGHRKGDPQCLGFEPHLMNKSPELNPGDDQSQVEDEHNSSNSSSEDEGSEDSRGEQETQCSDMEEGAKTVQATPDQTSEGEGSKDVSKAGVRKSRSLTKKKQKPATGKIQKKNESQRDAPTAGETTEERGRSVQTTLVSHIQRAERAPSLKRQNPPSPTERGQEAQRPRR